MGIVNYESPKMDPSINRHAYIIYVDKLREEYSIRVEIPNVKLNDDTTVYDEHQAFRKHIELYLRTQLPESAYCIQETNTIRSQFVWFTNNEDALAFILTWNGRII